MRPLAHLALAISLPMLACGSSGEGAKCNTTGFLCADTTAALECKASVWVRLPCKGPAGCTREGDLIKCDMSANDAQDNCASTAEGTGLCTKDMQGTLECREGKLIKTHECRSCKVTDAMVDCTPP